MTAFIAENTLGFVAVVGIFAAVATAFARGIMRDRRWRARQLELVSTRRTSGAAAELDESARLNRLEQAIDAIAIEVERLGEGQRFLTKLLTEKHDDVHMQG